MLILVFVQVVFKMNGLVKIKLGTSRVWCYRSSDYPQCLRLPAAPLKRDFRFAPTNYGECARYCGSNNLWLPMQALKNFRDR